MNTFEAAVVARLKAAGLLEIAERAAKRVELRLRDCITSEEVTGGHRALWAALAGTKKTPAQIAALVGFQEAVVAAVMPAPESGPRVRKAAAAALVAPELATPRLPTQVAALLAALEERAQRIGKAGARMVEEATALERDVAAVRAMLNGIETAASTNARAIAVAHLRAHGDTGVAVEIADRHGVSPELLLSGSMHRSVCAARRDIAVFYSARKMSQAKIARLLHVGQGAIFAMLKRAAQREAA